jgi:hypothetical protein
MRIIINIQGIKDNAQHIAGLVIGSFAKAPCTKEQRGTKWYSTVAVTLAQQGVYQWFPYRMMIIK